MTPVPLSCSASSQIPSGTSAVAVPVLAGQAPEPLDRAYCHSQGFSGEVGEALAAPAAEGRIMVAVGLGQSVDAEALRQGAAAFVRSVWRNGTAAFPLGAELLRALPAAQAAQAVVEGALLAGYRFTTYKGSPDALALTSLVVAGDSQDGELERGVRGGQAVARAVCLARDLVNEPAGTLTPRRLAEVAEKVGEEAGLEVRVWDEVDIANEGLGGLAGVARGSEEPPRLIKLTYSPPGAGQSVPTVALVGKGITFDSGGLSIKTADGMTAMKTDMGGAAAVLGTMSALGEMEVAVRVLGYMPTTENMPSGKATKPGDVLKIRNGKTIEVLNTDAEGRLVLADGLSLAVEDGADAIVDLATLTGSCVVALGREIAGLMGNHEGLIGQVRAASARAAEPVWPLPLPDRYRRHIESDVADMKNTGRDRQAGTLVAGLILSEFVDDVPWAHLDIAGPARSDEDRGYLRKGATGFGVRTLLELLGAFEPVARGAGASPA
jgi:leucyl aminopeptidase